MSAKLQQWNHQLKSVWHSAKNKITALSHPRVKLEQIRLFIHSQHLDFRATRLSHTWKVDFDLAIRAPLRHHSRFLGYNEILVRLHARRWRKCFANDKIVEKTNVLSVLCWQLIDGKIERKNNRKIKLFSESFLHSFLHQLNKKKVW